MACGYARAVLHLKPTVLSMMFVSLGLLGLNLVTLLLSCPSATDNDRVAMFQTRMKVAKAKAPRTVASHGFKIGGAASVNASTAFAGPVSFPLLLARWMAAMVLEPGGAINSITHASVADSTLWLSVGAVAMVSLIIVLRCLLELPRSCSRASDREEDFLQPQSFRKGPRKPSAEEELERHLAKMQQRGSDADRSRRLIAFLQATMKLAKGKGKGKGMDPKLQIDSWLEYREQRELLRRTPLEV